MNKQGINNPMYGRKHTQEWIDNLKKRHKENHNYGMKGKTHTKETKDVMSKKFKGGGNPFYGKKHSEETKRKISLSSKERPVWNKGKKLHYTVWNKGLKGEELKKHYKSGFYLSKIKGKTYEEIYGVEKAKAFKEKLSLLRKGKRPHNYTLETRRKMSLSKRGKKNPKKSLQMKLNNPSKRLEFRREASKRMIGEGNHQWLGGLSFEPYTKEFNIRFKRLIREREGFTCLKCNMREEDSFVLFKRKLTIHHINYNKKLTIPENCCCLCIRCNAEVNSNRKSWTTFFQSILSKRYNYQYEENQPIINLEVKQ